MDILNRLIGNISKMPSNENMKSVEKVTSVQETESVPFKKTSTEDLENHGFRIGRILGEGSYSSVRAATYNGQDIAVKVINRDKISKDFANKFLPREIEILSKVRHENIVHIYKIFNYPRRVYIFMEMLQKGDLLNYIRSKGRLSESKARHYMKQMVSALLYLHNLNIAHRDIKCENVMLDHQDNVRLIDFGFCRSTVSKSGRRILSETYCGSTAYAAPEVLQGSPYNPMMYDVWSLGCVLFIMVAGSMPFDDSNIRKMVDNQIKRRIKFPHGVTLSSGLKKLIKRMLEPDVMERMSLERVNRHKWLKEETNDLKSSAVDIQDLVSSWNVRTE